MGGWVGGGGEPFKLLILICISLISMSLDAAAL